MTDSPHLDPARLSDLLDGTGGPSDAAHVAACRECAGRLESWRRSRRLLAAHPPAPPGRQEAAIQAALAAFGVAADAAGEEAVAAGPDGSAEPEAAPSAGFSSGPPVAGPGSSSGTRRGPRWGLRSGAVAAAIAVAVFAGGITAAVELHGPSTGKSSTVAGPSSRKAAGTTSAASGGVIAGSSSGAAASASSAHPPSASGSPLTTLAGPSLGPKVPPSGVASLGVVPDQEVLAARLRVALARSAGVATGLGTSPPLLACAADAAAVAGLARTAAPELEAVATYAGQPADVFVFGPVHEQAIAVSATTCRLLVAVDI